MTRRRGPLSVGGNDGGLAIDRLVRIAIAAAFDLDEDDLADPVTQETVPGWTSRSHMMLILGLEERFGVSFTLEQIVAMTSAERIAAVLRQLLPETGGP